MRRPRKKTIPLLLPLGGGLGVWCVKQADALADARPPAEDPGLPDTSLPKLTAHNAEFAGLAPGYSAPAGETEDRITVLDMADRIMIKKKRARKGAPAAAASHNAWTPDVYPMTRLFAAPGQEITPLDVRDPAALVLPPADLR